MLDSKRAFKIKVSSVLEILLLSLVLNLKYFSWKRDFPISLKPQTSES